MPDARAENSTRQNAACGQIAASDWQTRSSNFLKSCSGEFRCRNGSVIPQAGPTQGWLIIEGLVLDLGGLVWVAYSAILLLHFPC
jgi:hypothetical protein